MAAVKPCSIARSCLESHLDWLLKVADQIEGAVNPKDASETVEIPHLDADFLVRDIRFVVSELERRDVGWLRRLLPSREAQS